MRAAVYLAEMTGQLSAEDSVDILETLRLYGPIPPLDGIRAESLLARLVNDKKTVQRQGAFRAAGADRRSEGGVRDR